MATVEASLEASSRSHWLLRAEPARLQKPATQSRRVSPLCAASFCPLEQLSFAAFHDRCLPRRIQVTSAPPVTSSPISRTA
eukprot:10204983-Prorocentrum_lima.AAC.1